MRFPVLIVAALALLPGCNKGPENNPPQQARTSTPTTPANVGQPRSHEEKKDGKPGTGGEVDPKAPEQHRDFQQRGDGAGPTGPDTEPKRGG